jgi:glycine/D-amino acid oxidase-like deaminating enzyme
MDERLATQRRAVLASLLASGASAWVPPVRSGAPPLRVGVVGAGIVGASIARHLARSGAQVWVFEKLAPAQGATQNSFAWLNAFVDDAHYRALRLESLKAYHELDRSLALNIVWGGYLNWASNAAEAEVVRANAQQLAGTAQPTRRISAREFMALDPAIIPGPITEAIYSPIDGHLDPVQVTRRFLDDAVKAGAKLLYPCELSGLELNGSRLQGVATTQGRFGLDRLVVAAGVDTPRLLAMARCPLSLKHAPGILAHSAPLPVATQRVHDAPGTVEFKQMADGSVVGTDAPSPPDTPAHQEIRADAMSFPSDELRTHHGNRILGRIARFLPAAAGAKLERLTLGFRPMPTDGFPIVGALPTIPDIHVAVTHSGVTLAPIIGRLTTEEVLRGSSAKWLQPYRPERFGPRAAA